MTRRHLRGRYAAGVCLAAVGLRTVELSIVLASVLLVVCPCAFALNPELDVSQYAHTECKIRAGFTKGQISSIAQTPDGYLWLGTEFGLYRFDGIRAVGGRAVIWGPAYGRTWGSHAGFIKLSCGTATRRRSSHDQQSANVITAA